MRTLVTGARGSIGSELCERLKGEILATDLEDMDVRDYSRVLYTFDRFRPDLVYHLAAQKSAPDAEADPTKALFVGGLGTANVLQAAREWDARVILASTCKAADPETVYGAMKLLAERLVLQAGGTVARFYNVRESQGNVFEIWGRLDSDAALPVTPCWRYFIHLDEAVQLLRDVSDLPSGRYTINPGPLMPMSLIGEIEYPGRPQVKIPPRRGDRIREPRHAACERLSRLGDGLERVDSHHDLVREPVCA